MKAEVKELKAGDNVTFNFFSQERKGIVKEVVNGIVKVICNNMILHVNREDIR